MAETNSKKILSLIRELRDLIKNAQEQWNIPVKSPGTTGDRSKEAVAIANVVHPLGPINVVGLSKEFSQKIESISSLIASYQRTTVQEIAQITGMDPMVKKYLSYLKDESKNLNSLSEVQENIKICKNLALDACQNTFKFVIQQTTDVSKKLGFRINTDIEGTLSMWGSIIVMDINFDEAANKIIKVTINIASESHQNDKDDLVDNLLTQQLSDFKNFKLFQKNLQALATLDTLSKINHPLDCFLCIKCIANDIKSIYDKEFSASGGDIPKIMTDGHGIPLFHVERVGPSIAYWAPRSRILEMDWDVVKYVMEKGENHNYMRNFHRLWITMEETRSAQVFLPPERNHYLIDEDDDEFELMQRYDIVPDDITFLLLPTPLKFLQPKENSIGSTFVQFVSWLEPPVYAVDTIAKAIGSLSGFFFSSGSEKRDPQSLSLEQLLIEDVISSVKSSSSDRGTSSEIRWEKKFDDSPYVQVYSYDTKSHTDAKKIERIPFIHPYQIFSSFKFLRRQLVFNTLFQSCFNSSTYKPFSKSQNTSAEATIFEESQPTDIQVHVQIIDPPNSLSVTFQVPEIVASVSLQITILEDSRLYVLPQILGERNDNRVITDELLTRVLQICQDVPMLVRWTLKSLLNNARIKTTEDEIMKLDGFFTLDQTENYATLFP
ncbi:4654_t:CDS:10 [Acaulospora morrowiae]|uniref:Mediator of RNA polymerase II transcription subunit 1 n=1 Tax=Acaulospora morrowiae TaxID=94023 RepID=A0A9N9FNT3_9GLOM|nr:4654_t:CDS:10 [Acaulospora morrowiae]